MMTKEEFVAIVRADLFRDDGRKGFKAFLAALWNWPGFRYVFLMRLCQFLRSRFLFRISLYHFVKFFYVRTGLRYGIRIPLSCKVGKGLYIGHWGGIWVNPAASIGKNCSLGHEVTIGHMKGAGGAGAPEVGDNVFIGPGAKVVGKIRVGDHALISANSLVMQDVPESGVMIGVPAKLFSRQGSAEYVTWTNYE